MTDSVLVSERTPESDALSELLRPHPARIIAEAKILRTILLNDRFIFNPLFYRLIIVYNM